MPPAQLCGQASSGWPDIVWMLRVFPAVFGTLWREPTKDQSSMTFLVITRRNSELILLIGALYPCL